MDCMHIAWASVFYYFSLLFFVTLLIHDGGRDLASWTSESIIKLLWKKKKEKKEKVKTKASQQENYFKSYIDQFSSWCVYRKTKRAEIFELDELHEYSAFKRNKKERKKRFRITLKVESSPDANAYRNRSFLRVSKILRKPLNSVQRPKR